MKTLITSATTTASLAAVLSIGLQPPGLAHPTKESVHFTVTGPGVLFDEVPIWKAK